jgi:Hsp70 protein
MIHCVLLTTDDNGRQSSINRVIDVDVTDGLTRAGRVNSGIDLMLGNAHDRGGRVGPIGVAYRTDEHAREIASRGTGAKRQIQLIAETEAVAHRLASSGEISRFGSVAVVDLGDTGMSLYTLDPRTGRAADLTRSEAISGTALDALLVEECSVGGRFRGRRRSVLSACRTAKEELSVRQSTSLTIGGAAGLGTFTRSSFEDLARPMAQAAATVVADYAATSGADAVVLIGGIANIPLVRTLITREVGIEAVLPRGPESVAATGAASLAAASNRPAGLAFIGGRRSREWLSAAPLAMFGALLAGALMTVYAVGSSLAGNPSTPEAESAAPSVPSVIAEAPPQTQVSPTSPSTTQVTSTPTITPAQTTQEVAPPSIGGHQDPGWQTTELPPPAAPSDSPTRTLNPSLIPFPLPSIPWPPTLVPPSTLPPESTGPEQPSETVPDSAPGGGDQTESPPPPPPPPPPAPAAPAAPSDIQESGGASSDPVLTSPPAT